MKIARVLGSVVIALLVIAVTSSCQQQMSEPTAPQVDLEAMRSAFVAAWNDGEVDRYDTICMPDYVAHEVASQVTIEGLESYKEWMRSIRAAFPDMDWRIDDILAAGNKVAALWSWSGTHTGTLPASPLYAELPATGETVSSSGVAVFHLVDGMISESWSYSDMLAPLQQLGFTITPPAEASE